MLSLLEAALDYASIGWSVIPIHSPAKDGKCSCGRDDCHSPAKHPRTSNGIKDASTDPVKISAWWARWPDANIGIVAEPSNLIIIDIDPRNGGDKTWKSIECEDVLTPRSKTGGGGEHIFFTHNGRELPGKLGAGVDVKYRGYVVAAPSRHISGQLYEWTIPPNGQKPIPLPDWVKPHSITIEQTGAQSGIDKVKEKWYSQLQSAREGERNETLNKAAWVLGGLVHTGHLTQSEVEKELLAIAKSIGLSDTESIRTIKSGLSAGQKNPIEWDVTHDYYPNVFAPPDVETAPEDEQPYPDEWPNPYTLEDAYMDRPPVVYVVDGILAEETVNMVYGDSGSLKSMLLADMCTCVSSGLSWLPNASGEGVKVNSGPVMWIDYDNGSRRSHNRFGALARARSLDTHTPIYYYSMAQPQLAANDSKHIGALYQRIMSRSVKLLVIDNLSLVSGDADENSRDMAQVLAGFRFLAERTGACIVIVHHQNKPSAVSRKTGDLLRGHSSIKAGLDVALYILRDGDEENRSDDIFISAPKTRDNDIHPFAARFCYTSMRQNELTTAKFIGIDWKDSGARSNEKMDEKIVHHLSNIGDVCAKNALHDVVGGRYKQFGEALERLVSTGTVKRQSGAKGAILYSLTSSPPPTSSGRR